MATLATPGIAINRGRIVQRASVESSICESVFDETPIFIARLVDESGCKITGGRAAAGSCGATSANLSCTICRARINSVSGSKISTTDERPSTDLDRSVFNCAVPVSAFSTGTLIRLSTSAVERPGASV
ncbi:MAG: hypothetical protein JMDDDDMK_05140 [Acidobacteria bacterium]|nr:hypothetical protein [Acidobacteriota bacterium]